MSFANTTYSKRNKSEESLLTQHKQQPSYISYTIATNVSNDGLLLDQIKREKRRDKYGTNIDKQDRKHKIFISEDIETVEVENYKEFNQMPEATFIDIISDISSNCSCCIII